MSMVTIDGVRYRVADAERRGLLSKEEQAPKDPAKKARTPKNKAATPANK